MKPEVFFCKETITSGQEPEDKFPEYKRYSQFLRNCDTQRNGTDVRRRLIERALRSTKLDSELREYLLVLKNAWEKPKPAVRNFVFQQLKSMQKANRLAAIFEDVLVRKVNGEYHVIATKLGPDVLEEAVELYFDDRSAFKIRNELYVRNGNKYSMLDPSQVQYYRGLVEKAAQEAGMDLESYVKNQRALRRTKVRPTPKPRVPQKERVLTEDQAVHIALYIKKPAE